VRRNDDRSAAIERGELANRPDPQPFKHTACLGRVVITDRSHGDAALRADARQSQPLTRGADDRDFPEMARIDTAIALLQSGT
jgi:hypothetical protein